MLNLLWFIFSLVISVDELTPENTLYWRCLAEYMHKEDAEADELAEKIIPVAATFSKFIAECVLLLKHTRSISLQ